MFLKLYALRHAESDVEVTRAIGNPLSVAPRWQCHSCALFGEHYTCARPDEMLMHLWNHIHKGQKVPELAMDELREEARELKLVAFVKCKRSSSSSNAGAANACRKSS